MMGILLALAAGTTALMSQSSPSSNAVEPLIGGPVERFPQPADFHAKVRAEPRDSDWATRTESAIRARLLQIPLIGKDGNALRITCARTICEIAGTVAVPSSNEGLEDPTAPHNIAIRDLQVAPLPDDLAKIGLKSESASFTGSKGKPERSVFLVYYSRMETKPN